MLKHMKEIIFSVIGLLILSSLALADDDRHIAVDQAIGGMEQGSRIQAPGSTPTSAHKTISSSQGTKKAEVSSAQPITAGENHGNIYSASAPAQENSPVNTVPAGSGTETGQTGTGETSAESGGTESGTGPTEGASNPIVDTEVNVNPGSGTVEADATVDTSGELEDKQIFDADLGAQDVTSIDAEVGSATDITGQEVVEGADITTSGQTGQTSGSTQIETVPQETTNSPTTESGSTQEPSEPSSNPILATDANVNPESGTVEADATVDTSGELEERQIIDADVAAGETIATETEVGSATDVTQSDIVESADITTQPVQTVIPIPSDLTAEVDTTIWRKKLRSGFVFLFYGLSRYPVY
ncbi:MAG: hypothetical protein HY210_01450 [Candidatus Omnitrophica bacterium]|nr:hypothetical protein [Candidatus Omnitrophota bacterium]